MMKITIRRNKQVPDSSEEESGIENHSSGTSGSDIKEKSSYSPEYACSNSTSDGQENSPSSSGLKSSPVISDDGQRISPSTSDGQENSPSSSGLKSSPVMSDGLRILPNSTSDDQRKSLIISDSLRNSSSIVPQWLKTARRGRKSFSTSAASSDASIEKQKEPPFGEKELVHTMMHLWSLSNSLSSANREKDATTRSPKKRKLEDILCTEDGSKKARLGKKKNDLEVIHKQTPVYSSASDKYRCDNCGRPFSSHQALGGHKSSCNIYFRKNEAGESSAQGSMRNQNNKIDESSKDFASSTAHRCKVCFKCFPSGQALGGHQKSHPQVKPQIGSLLSLSAPNEEVRKESLSIKEPLVSWSSSVSQPMNISVDSLCPINSMASVQEEQDDVMNKMNISVDPLCPVNPSTSVEEAQEDDVKNKKINMMFDLNEVPPEDEDELDLKV